MPRDEGRNTALHINALFYERYPTHTPAHEGSSAATCAATHRPLPHTGNRQFRSRVAGSAWYEAGRSAGCNAGCTSENWPTYPNRNGSTIHQDWLAMPRMPSAQRASLTLSVTNAQRTPARPSRRSNRPDLSAHSTRSRHVEGYSCGRLAQKGSPQVQSHRTVSEP
jgi:hypothetical protein